MKIDVLQTNLLTGIKTVSRFLSTKPQLPILSCILLEARNSEIWLTATDLNIGMRQKIAGSVVEEGSCVIPAKVFSELVSSLTGSVSLVLSGLSLSVTSNQTKSVVNTFPEQDFPPFPQVEGETLTLPASILSDAVNYVTFTSSKDENRPILTAVLFALSEQSHIVATDGYCMSLLEPALSVKEPKQILFPAKAINEIEKVVVSQKVDTVMLSFSQGAKQVFFSLPSAQIVLRTLEGEFPNYKAVIPKEFAIEVSVDADELQHHIRSAMIFSAEGSSIVQIEVFPDQMSVSAHSSLLGEYTSSLSAKSNTQESLKIAFNGRYLLEFLQRIAGEECQIYCNDPLKPVRLSCKKIPQVTYIAVPFKLSS